MKYPSLVDIEAMRSRGDDTSVIEQQLVLYQRGRLPESIKAQMPDRAWDREHLRRALAGFWSA